MQWEEHYLRQKEEDSRSRKMKVFKFTRTPPLYIRNVCIHLSLALPGPNSKRKAGIVHCLPGHRWVIEHPWETQIYTSTENTEAIARSQVVSQQQGLSLFVSCRDLTCIRKLISNTTFVSYKNLFVHPVKKQGFSKLFSILPVKFTNMPVFK